MARQAFTVSSSDVVTLVIEDWRPSWNSFRDFTNWRLLAATKSQNKASGPASIQGRIGKFQHFQEKFFDSGTDWHGCANGEILKNFVARNYTSLSKKSKSKRSLKEILVLSSCLIAYINVVTYITFQWITNDLTMTCTRFANDLLWLTTINTTEDSAV